MLVWRIVLSLVLSSVLAGLFWFDHRCGATAPVLLVFTLLLAARATWELVELLKTRHARLSLGLTLTGTSLVIIAGWWPAWTQLWDAGTAVATPLASLGMICLALATVVLMSFIAGTIRYQRPGNSMETLCAELMSVCYVGLLLALTAQLRWVAGSALGYYALASVIVSAKSGDVGAYIFGKNLGGPKMAPLLSPAKTWAGAVGAIVGSIAGGSAWLIFALRGFDKSSQPGDWWWIVLYTAVIGLAGMVGDVCESLIKRDVGRKDSAPLMPGFGGILDLLDSVLFAGPVALVMWMTLPLIVR